MRKFVVHRHYAQRAGLHDDLRLELRKGSLSSWAIPKLIPLEPDRKVLAIETEPHDMTWYNFQGVIADGYGKGRMSILDRGKMDIIKNSKNSIIVDLHGIKGKVSGQYVLIRLKPDSKDKSWLLWKRKGG